MAELQKPDASMQRIGDLIAADIAMTAKLLQLVNSSFFGLAQRVTKVSQAVTLLGADTIKALTLSVGVFRNVKARKHESMNSPSTALCRYDCQAHCGIRANASWRLR